MSANTEQMYNSAGMPIGTRKVYIYRLTAPPLPPAFPLASPGGNTGSGASAASAAYATGSATLLGIYNLEMLGWQAGAKEVERNLPSGADLDFALLRQKITGSATVQLATGQSPLLLSGCEIFEISPGYQADGVTALPLQRFVIAGSSKSENEGAANNQSVTLRFDRNNSDTYWSA